MVQWHYITQFISRKYIYEYIDPDIDIIGQYVVDIIYGSIDNV